MKLEKTFHDNGKKRAIYPKNKNNQLHGIVTIYYPNGQMMKQAEYVNGQVDGIAYLWYMDGELASKMLYRKGELIKIMYNNPRQFK